MIKHYLSFWAENRDILLGGRLEPKSPSAYYTRAVAHKDGKAIASLYTSPILEGGYDSIIAINASPEKEIVVKKCEGKSYRVTDCMGNDVASGVIDADTVCIAVPLCGFIYID